jgi:hypothetical protein
LALPRIAVSYQVHDIYRSEVAQNVKTHGRGQTAFVYLDLQVAMLKNPVER